jgi:hypothetical protein
MFTPPSVQRLIAATYGTTVVGSTRVQHSDLLGAPDFNRAVLDFIADMA